MYVLVLTTIILTGEMQTSHTEFSTKNRCEIAKNWIMEGNGVGSYLNEYTGGRIIGDCVRAK